MELYTIQLAQRALCAVNNIILLDTTVKSGDRTFAPTWSMVMGHKAGTLSDAAYTQQYHDRMDASYQANPTRWLEVAGLRKVAFGCYCRAGVFCHRHLLAERFRLVCAEHQLPYRLVGELIREPKPCQPSSSAP